MEWSGKLVFVQKIIGYALLVCMSLSVPVAEAALAGATTKRQTGQTQFKVQFTPVKEQQLNVLTEYRLSKYDVINVAILGFDEANFKNIMVGPDGYVNLPYAGTIKLGGLAIPEATQLLKEKLGDYLKIPGMAVMVTQYGPRKVYVLGEVKVPGVHTLGWDNMNIIAALSDAGGIALKGRPKHVAVVRQIDGKIQMQEVNFDRLVEQADLTQNIALLDGDLVYVPKSNKIDLNTDIMPIVSTGLFMHQMTN
ncbi:MAG: polysaccharide export protein Wza [Firmicutes bacterium]|nr:polysaccharide export protein Wza [Bacillota bacterium]